MNEKITDVHFNVLLPFYKPQISSIKAAKTDENNLPTQGTQLNVVFAEPFSGSLREDNFAKM